MGVADPVEASDGQSAPNLLTVSDVQRALKVKSGCYPLPRAREKRAWNKGLKPLLMLKGNSLGTRLQCTLFVFT